MEKVTKENFWEMGARYIAARYPPPIEKLPTIQHGTEQFNAWQDYFQNHLLWIPAQLEACLHDPEKRMTVPAEWPVHFDDSFINGPAPPAPAEMEDQEIVEKLATRIRRRVKLPRIETERGRCLLGQAIDLFMSDRRPEYLSILWLHDQGLLPDKYRSKDLGRRTAAMADSLMQEMNDAFDRHFGG